MVFSLAASIGCSEAFAKGPARGQLAGVVFAEGASEITVFFEEESFHAGFASIALPPLCH